MGTATAARAARIVLIRVGAPIDADADADADVSDDESAALREGYLALAGRDPATQVPDADLIEAAMRYAQTAEPAAGAFPDATAWARYAYRAARTLHGIYHPRTVEATEALIWVLYSRGLDREACALRRQLIQLHLDHGDTAAHLTARVDLAGHLHGIGRCDTAIKEATTGWNTWTEQVGAHHPAGLTLVLQLVGLLAGCRRIPEALVYIEQAKRLCPSQGAPAFVPASALIRTLIVTAFHHRSVCTDRRGGGHDPDAAQLEDLNAVWTGLLP